MTSAANIVADDFVCETSGIQNVVDSRMGKHRVSEVGDTAFGFDTTIAGAPLLAADKCRRLTVARSGTLQ